MRTELKDKVGLKVKILARIGAHRRFGDGQRIFMQDIRSLDGQIICDHQWVCVAEQVPLQQAAVAPGDFIQLTGRVEPYVKVRGQGTSTRFEVDYKIVPHTVRKRPLPRKYAPPDIAALARADLAGEGDEKQAALLVSNSHEWLRELAQTVISLHRRLEQLNTERAAVGREYARVCERISTVKQLQKGKVA